MLFQVLLLPHEYSDCIHQGDMQRKRVGKAHKDSGYIDRHDCRIVYWPKRSKIVQKLTLELL